MKKTVGRWVFAGICLIFSILFNLAAWKSTSFSDFYTDNIFPRITRGYGRFTSIFPFSVGEIMLVLLVILAGVLVVYLAGLCVIAILKKAKKTVVNSRIHEIKKILGKLYLNVFTILVPIVLVIMSLNCFVLYHCSPIMADNEKSEHDIEELAKLRDYIVEKCNELSEEMPRDGEGNVIYEGDMVRTAQSAMGGLSGQFPRLDGFYVTPKALLLSGFMSQQYMQGYYFPFSMEANYNNEMYIMNKPFTMCHELSHTHGYIYEDEANFLGFLACIGSEDKVFVYSGYLGVLNYVNNDYYKAVGSEEYKSHVEISDKVRFDDQFLTSKAWEKVEKRAVLKTETVKKAADTFIDTNLKVNGVSSGKISYTHVVSLLLDYYSKGDKYEE